MRGYLARVGGLFVNPKPTMVTIVHEKRSFFEPLFTVVLFSVLSTVSSYLAVRNVVSSVLSGTVFSFLAGGVMDFVIGSLMLPLFLISDLGGWLLNGLLIYVVAKVMDGPGSFEDTLSVVGYTYVVKVFTAAPLILVPLYPIAGLMTSVAMSFVGLIWSLYLLIVGVSEVNGFSTGQAFICVIIPILLSSLGLFLFTIGWPALIHWR